MAKRIYEQTAIKWAISIALLLGSPIFLYFAYSNQIGAITITGKSWTDFCNATSWDNPADIPCIAYIDFHANEDTFWYPVNYDPYGRSTPYMFDPNVKDWKLERSWGKGWREIPLTKSCTGTWCGLSNNKDTRLFSVAWREGRDYKTRVSAIKYHPQDSIYWEFGDLDPYWYGYNITPSCIWKNETKKIYKTCVDQITYTTCLNNSGPNTDCSQKQKARNYRCFDRKIIVPICEKEIGYTVDKKELECSLNNHKCLLSGLRIEADSCADGNCDGILDSGESGCYWEIDKGLKKTCRGDTPPLRKIAGSLNIK